MARKRVTKKDPRVELSPYLKHRSQQRQRKAKPDKLSASLTGLHRERRSALVFRLGLLLLVSVVAIVGLAYYVSPLANVRRVEVSGAADIPSSLVVKSADISPSDKVVDYWLGRGRLTRKLTSSFPEISGVSVRISRFNQLNLGVKEKRPIGYVKNGSRYRKILPSGRLGSQSLTWNEVQPGAALFIGYAHDPLSLRDDLTAFNSLPRSFKNQVKMMSGSSRRRSQIIFVMKNGDLVVGNLATIRKNITYYPEVSSRTKPKSMIDLELTPFTRALTKAEKQRYDIS